MRYVSLFEYCYSDASNFKAWGSVLLQGGFIPTDVARLQQCFEAGEFFIAEQLGLLPLYAELWACSGGPTSDDHVWHTFYALRRPEPDEANGSIFDTVDNFVSHVETITHWNGKLSPHWGL